MRAKHYLMIPLVAFSLAACQQRTDEKYFRGQITLQPINQARVVLQGELISFDAPTSHNFALHDSLIVFRNYLQTGFHMRVFNLHTREQLGEFIHYGQGRNEALALQYSLRLHEEDGELKYLGFSGDQSRLFLWNITQSLQQGRTVYDQVANYQWMEEHQRMYDDVMYINKDTLLTFTNSHVTWRSDISFNADGTFQGSGEMLVDRNDAPFYQLRTLSTNQPLRRMELFVPFEVSNYEIDDLKYRGNVALSPDRKQVVEAMSFLPQINIIDLESAAVSGYRLEGLDDFSTLISTGVGELCQYHGNVEASSRNIFASWVNYRDGEITKEEYYEFHVYDWQGKMVKIIEIDHCPSGFSIDEANNFLYVYNAADEQLYRYDLNEAGL